MTLLLPTLAVTFAAFCVWLTVRIVNRKERWAKWTLAGVVGVPVLYVASFGPACWITSRIADRGEWISFVYAPMIYVWGKSPDPVFDLFRDYTFFGSDPEWRWELDNEGHFVRFVRPTTE